MINNKTALLELLKKAQAVRLEGIAEDKLTLGKYALELTPMKIEHPPATNGDEKVIWTASEKLKLLQLCRDMRENSPSLKWEKMTQDHRRYYMTKAIEAIQERFFPPHRRRSFPGLRNVSQSLALDLCKIFDLPNPFEAPLTTPISTALDRAAHVPERTPVPQDRSSWTTHEEGALLIHLAEAMRNQGIPIPEGSDRFGSIMFKDMIIAAQNATLPVHRRRDLTQARQVLANAGMLERLQKLLDEKKPTTTYAPVEENPAQLVSAPNPAQKPKTNGTALAEALRSLANIFETALETAHKEAEEARELCELAVQENSELRLRLGNVEDRVSNLQQNNHATPPAPRKALPRVAILGCHLNEFVHVMQKSRELGLELELKHYEQDSTPTFIREEYAVMMKWASREWMDKMKSIPADRRAITQGGPSRAVMQLQTWFAPVPAVAV